MIPYIATDNFLVFTWADGTPRQVLANHRNFNKIVELIKSTDKMTEADDFDALLMTLEELLTPRVMLNRIASDGSTELSINPDTEELTCTVDGNPVKIPTALADYILSLYAEKGNLSPLIKFLTKMSRNPDKDIASQIWGFISSCGLCLTEDGNFLSYKNVNANFTSIYDGRTDNTPGTTLKMDRSQVEKNPDRTCSYGLHFAAWGYLNHYSSGSGTKTVLVSTSPEHVVSIPSDYNDQKGRACEYTIVREVARPEELKSIVIFDENT